MKLTTNRDGLDPSECEELAREIIKLAASQGCPAGQSPVHFFAGEIARLREALRKLTTEVAGITYAEAELRLVCGDTNYNCLMRRVEEARAALKVAVA